MKVKLNFEKMRKNVPTYLTFYLTDSTYFIYSRSHKLYPTTHQLNTLQSTFTQNIQYLLHPSPYYIHISFNRMRKVNLKLFLFFFHLFFEFVCVFFFLPLYCCSSSEKLYTRLFFGICTCSCTYSVITNGKLL